MNVKTYLIHTGADDFDIKNILIGTACMFGFSVLFLTSIVVAYTIKLYKRIRLAIKLIES